MPHLDIDQVRSIIEGALLQQLGGMRQRGQKPVGIITTVDTAGTTVLFLVSTGENQVLITVQVKSLRQIMSSYPS